MNFISAGFIADLYWIRLDCTSVPNKLCNSIRAEACEAESPRETSFCVQRVTIINMAIGLSLAVSCFSLMITQILEKSCHLLHQEVSALSQHPMFPSLLFNVYMIIFL